MRTLALRELPPLLLLALVAGCGGGATRGSAPATGPATDAGVTSCAELARALVRLPAPTSMQDQRAALAELARMQATLARRFSVRAGPAVAELSASLRAEHESISARRDSRVTASRRLHANAAARYARGRSLARAAASSCP